jgi:hypothetical protein
LTKFTTLSKEARMLKIEEHIALKMATARTALNYVGVTELGGNNKGQMVERFQRAVDGRAYGEPWCMAFVQYCLDEAKDMVEFMFQMSLPKSEIKESEHCMTVWNKSPVTLQKLNPEIGDIVIWQKYDHRTPTTSGHTGIVVNVWNETTIQTVEGNTSNKSQRDGDAVESKTRSIVTDIGSLKLKGFLSPY